jgi:hypothetical protein
VNPDDDMYPPGITRNKCKMGKSTNIQYPSIFTCYNAPALRHYPTIPRLGVPKGAPGGGGQNDKEMHTDIHIQQKRKEKKRGEEKKTKKQH